MIDIREQSPLALAFVGDAVYSLKIREHIVNEKRHPVSKLNSISVQYVSAKGQYSALKLIEHMLTEDESAWVRRGRNTTKTTVSKHADPEEYRASTGFECMLGYLELTGQKDRIEFLVDYILKNTDILHQSVDNKENI